MSIIASGGETCCPDAHKLIQGLQKSNQDGLRFWFNVYFRNRFKVATEVETQGTNFPTVSRLFRAGGNFMVCVMTRASRDDRRFVPSAERNREPICEALTRILPPCGTLVEIASGTGQHAAYMAPKLNELAWVPSEPDPALRRSIRAWSAEVATDNLRAPRHIDVREADWRIEDLIGDLVAFYNANMFHISDWITCQGMISGAGRYLRKGGVLCLYGPFKRGGEHTAASNAHFDAELRSQNPTWGIRDLDVVAAEATYQGLLETSVVEMPANNLLVVFTKT